MFATETSYDPDFFGRQSGEFFCWNEDCAVQEVEVALCDDEGAVLHQIKMRCPQCGNVLEFRHYTKEVMLLPERKE